MSTAADIMQSRHATRISLRGHMAEIMTRITEGAVLPYYLFVFIYMGVYSPFRPHPPETAIAALLKIVPIWYLTVYTYRRRSQNAQSLQVLKALHMSPDSLTEQLEKTDERQTSATRSSQGCFLASLVVSSIGDICLVYKYLFMAGIFCFGIAHVFNLLALRRLYELSSKAWLSVPMGFLMYAVLFSGINDSVFKIIVFLYAVLIHSMLFFAIAGYESFPCSSTLSSMLGASLFVISDFLIACNTWLMVTPHSEVSILLTYYVAQLLLTISNC